MVPVSHFQVQHEAISYSCGCAFEATGGVLCIHATAFVPQLRQYSAVSHEVLEWMGSSYMSFHIFFHPYWRRNRTLFSCEIRTSRFHRATISSTLHDGADRAVRETYHCLTEQSELDTIRNFSESRNMQDRLLQRMERRVPRVQGTFDNIMRTMLRATHSHILPVVSPHVTTSIGNECCIENPNDGNPRRKCGQKRARSALERPRQCNMDTSAKRISMRPDGSL